MPKTIAAVPDSITREAYTALMEGLGFDPYRLASLRFEPDGIYAVVPEPAEPNGSALEGVAEHTWTGWTDEVVRHTIYVPVVG